MANIIEIDHLGKWYGSGRNRRMAVDELSLDVQEGDIFGFVGPNGAGKTSTIRIMSTLLRPTSGDVRVAGCSARSDSRGVRRAIGYMPDFFGVYPDLTAWEYLDFFGACYRIPPAARLGLIEDLLALVDLTHRRHDSVESLSRGMKQRLSLARTLIHDPQVLILDEPASGLDPRARVEIRQLMIELARMGKTIFFSTHILADVAEICTRVAIIEAGKLVAAGTLEDLQNHLVPTRRIQVTVLDKAEHARALLAETPGILRIESLPAQNDGGRQRLEFDFSGDDAALSRLLGTMVGQQIPVIQFNSDSRDMEEVFMRATKGLVT
jgi:ABC-2 type transport system ATP-binding protein